MHKQKILLGFSGSGEKLRQKSQKTAAMGCPGQFVPPRYWLLLNVLFFLNSVKFLKLFLKEL